MHLAAAAWIGSLANPVAAESLIDALRAPGYHANVFLTAYPPLAAADAISDRFLSPIGAEAVRRRVAALHTALAPAMFGLAAARFAVFVPGHRPPSGYGLFVFVSPADQPTMPAGWQDVFEHRGMIFIVAYDSGNARGVFERRVPLALAATAALRSNVPIDPERTVIGGFSGGSRVALRIGLAYPDLFRNLFLNAGSDPIAVASTPLPSPTLFERFERSTHIALTTGDRDSGAQLLDDAALGSFSHWCVANIATQKSHAAGHDIASAQSLELALDAFEKRDGQDRLAVCRKARLSEVQMSLEGANAALGMGDVIGARRQILRIDQTVGGLAAPASISLADRCRCRILDPDASAGQGRSPAPPGNR